MNVKNYGLNMATKQFSFIKFRLAGNMDLKPQN